MRPVVAIALLSITSAACKQAAPTEGATPSPGSAAVDPWATPRPPTPRPDRNQLAAIAVTDGSGSAAPLARYLAATTVLAFWEPSCKPCLMELPQLSKLASELHDPNVSVVAVDVDDGDRAAALATLAQHHVTLPTVFDPDGALFRVAFGGGIMAVPGLAIVTADHIETERGYEPASDAEFVANWKQRLGALGSAGAR
jgi:thiol-disulfide isomerase/thioredoxin